MTKFINCFYNNLSTSMLPYPLKLILWTALLISVNCGAWQHYGNFTQDALNFIRSSVDTAIESFKAGKLGQNQFPKNISDALNEAWSPAWNVFIQSGSEGTIINAVMYGYAFRDHWIWLNEYSDMRLSVVIWKDYNCHTWVGLDVPGSLNTARANAFHTFITTALNTTPALYDDPWLLAYKTISEVIEANANEAYSAVITQGGASKTYGRFCVVSTSVPEYSLGYKSNGEKSVSYIIMRTR